MKLNLRLNTTFGQISPSEFVLTDDEVIEIEVIGKRDNGNGVLIIGENSYSEKHGIMKIPAERLKGSEHSLFEFCVMSGGSIVRRWKINPFFARFPESKLTYQDELKFYKDKYIYLVSALEKIEQTQTKLVADVVTLFEAVNNLFDNFEKVKEEMAI